MASSFEDLFEQLMASLRVAEKRHRAIRDDASDNSDWNAYDREGKLILDINKWRRNLEPLRSEIIASGAVADEDVPVFSAPVAEEQPLGTGAFVNIPTQAETPSRPKTNDEEIKVGKYIREKLNELSESGHVFSATQTQQLCDVTWSKGIFTYPPLLPFAKRYDNQHELSAQTKDENGKNRYWNEIFRFGDIDLLIISQWYAKDKESFDKWYSGLPRAIPPATPNTLIFRKTVDWSTLNYGISIPVANWDSFFSALGQTVNAGDSHNIIIEIEDSAKGSFRATAVHTVSGATNSVQIRYTQASEIVAELRCVFKSTLDYCSRERDQNGENSRILIPSDLAEYIDIYATETPNTLRFVCSPKTTVEVTDVDATEPVPESATVRIQSAKITLLGKEYSIRAWNEMFVKVCEVMLLHKPYVMAVMDRDANLNTEAFRNFSYHQSDMKRNGKRLSNGMWIETGCNHKDPLGFCRKILEKCGFSPDELQAETMEVI